MPALARYPLQPQPLAYSGFFLSFPPQVLLVSPLEAVFFTRVKFPQVMEVPVQPCIIATKNVQFPIVANWKERGMSRVWRQWWEGGPCKGVTDTHRLSGSGAPRAALGWLDSPASSQSWCQRLGCDCSKSHCWNGTAQIGQRDPQRHTCDYPALWLSGSPSSAQDCPGQEQRDEVSKKAGQGSALTIELPMVSSIEGGGLGERRKGRPLYR